MRAACAGCYTALHALELYAEAFDNVGALDRLEGFASFHGADFYGLPRSAERVTLRREAWTLPAELMGGDTPVVPLRGGETIGWRLAERAASAVWSGSLVRARWVRAVCSRPFSSARCRTRVIQIRS